MALQVTGTIKVNKMSFINPYIKVDFHGVDSKIHVEAKGWESSQDYTDGQPPTHTKPYFNVAPSNFSALAGNVAAAMQTRAEAYVKAQILAAFPTVTVADV